MLSYYSALCFKPRYAIRTSLVTYLQRLTRQYYMGTVSGVIVPNDYVPRWFLPLFFLFFLSFLAFLFLFSLVILMLFAFFDTKSPFIYYIGSAVRTASVPFSLGSNRIYGFHSRLTVGWNILLPFSLPPLAALPIRRLPSRGVERR